MCMEGPISVQIFSFTLREHVTQNLSSRWILPDFDCLSNVSSQKSKKSKQLADLSTFKNLQSRFNLFPLEKSTCQILIVISLCLQLCVNY